MPVVAAAIIAMSVMAYAQPPGVAIPGHYPSEFSGMGRIVRMADNQIVINEQLYFLSPRITYHTLEQEYAFGDEFRPGMLVGCVTGSKNLIVSLWFIEK